MYALLASNIQPVLVYKKDFYMLQEKFVKELDDAKRELKDLKAELEQQLSEKVNQKFF